MCPGSGLAEIRLHTTKNKGFHGVRQDDPRSEAKEKLRVPEKQSLSGSLLPAAVFALQVNIMPVMPDAVLKERHEPLAAILPLSCRTFRFALHNVHYV